MKSERIIIEPSQLRNDSVLFEKISSQIEQGAIFVYPTETIYGIGGSVMLPAVKDKIYIAKNRPVQKSMILIASRLEFFTSLQIEFPDVSKRLAESFWPGPLTIVTSSKTEPSGIAIRVTDHPFITALSEYFKYPIYSTSANLSGSPYNPDPEVIWQTFKDKVDFMIDIGFLPPSAPSTVVKINSDATVTVLREGAISKKEIEDKISNY